MTGGMVVEKKKDKKRDLEIPIEPGVYPVIDNDLARDNLENDIPAADLEDLHRGPSASSVFRG